MFGKRLNNIRKSRGFTAQQIADSININLHSYRKYESNDRQPSYEILIKLADKLNVSTDYLLCRDENTQSTEVSIANGCVPADLRAVEGDRPYKNK